MQSRVGSKPAGTHFLRIRWALLAISAAVLVAPATAGAASQVSYPSFSDVSALQLNGNAQQNGTTVQLTDPSPNEAGSVYTSSPVDVSGSWSVAYRLQFSAPGMADGAAFVIQPVSSTALTSSTSSYGGSGHGYQDVTPHIALDVDEYHDTAGIVVGSDAPTGGVRAFLPDHSDTPDWYVWADYDADTGTLNMYVSTNPTRPASPLVTSTGIDVASVLGTSEAYVGFAGATGTLTMGIDVASWFFGPPPQPPASEMPISVSGRSLSATEGAQFSGPVATVSGDSDSPQSDYEVQIDWGDGTTSSGTVDASGNVGGSHTYAEDGTYTVKTTVTDADDTSNSASAPSPAAVADAPLTPGRLTVSGGTEGSQATNVSFSLADADAGAPTSDFSATIDWGDGSTSNGTVSGSNGSYSVIASHTYGEEGSYPVSVTVNDEGGQSTSAAGSAVVSDAALSASSTSISSQPTFSGAVASFTDGNPGGSPKDFTANIDWGDGTTSTGAVSANSSGGFDVTGSHTYAQTGPYTVQVSIADDGGSSAQATSTILIYEFAGSGGGSFVLGDGNAAVGSQVYFWGSQWAADNPLSSGSAPASFKGFAEDVSSNTPVCGATFSTTPGDSSRPPAAVPDYMAVSVASAVSRQGPEIVGEIEHIVVVKTDPSYQADSGHEAGGEVVATLC